MRNNKFLYGKKVNFAKFLKHGSPLWFRDLYSLGRIENPIINDDESIRNQVVNSDEVSKITINGCDFKLADKSTIQMKLPTRRCHVLCLSKSGNDKILFDRFKADICIELETDKLIDSIRQGNKLKNLKIIGREVEYYKKGKFPLSHDPFELVFKKEYEQYHIENEYRIVLFWPNDEGSTVFTTDYKEINVFGETATNGDHIEIGFDIAYLKNIIVNINEI